VGFGTMRVFKVRGGCVELRSEVSNLDRDVGGAYYIPCRSCALAAMDRVTSRSYGMKRLRYLIWIEASKRQG
jgi:hypothetical protein